MSRTPNRNQATDQPTETQTTGAGGTSAGSDLAVVILAAGAGTRMKSATPKTLHAIGGRTLLATAFTPRRERSQATWWP